MPIKESRDNIVIFVLIFFWEEKYVLTIFGGWCILPSNLLKKQYCVIFKNIKNAKNCLQIQLWDDDEEFLVLFLMYIFNAGWWVIQSIHVHVLQIDCT